MLRAKHSGGMGIEGDSHRLATQKMRACNDLGNYPLVAEVHAIKVADSGDDSGGRGGDVGELAVDIQGVIQVRCRR
jgi:hypothetical protein